MKIITFAPAIQFCTEFPWRQVKKVYMVRITKYSGFTNQKGWKPQFLAHVRWLPYMRYA